MSDRGQAAVGIAAIGSVILTPIVIIAFMMLADWQVSKSDRAPEEARRAALAEKRERLKAFKEFTDNVKPEFSGKYFIVGEDTRLLEDPFPTSWSGFYLKAGSCVKVLRVSARQIEFDLKPPLIGAARATTRPAPNGTCELTSDPLGYWSIWKAIW